MKDSYFVGLDVLSSAGIGERDLRNRAAEIDSDFVRQAIGFTYGEIFARPGLDLKLRMIAAIAAQATAGNSLEQLREHVEAALHLGWSRAQLIEVIVQTAATAGAPAALKALADCHDLLIDPAASDHAACKASSDNGQE